MKSVSKLVVPLLAAVALAWGITAESASHREAPFIAMDPAADNTDVYAFVSYDAANLARAPADRRVTFILNVNPGQDPSDAPNYYNFDDEVLFSGRTLIAVPSNAGPATMPNYAALAAQGIYTDASAGIRVFAGQRAETFYIDLGAVFDTLNLRRYLPLLTGPGEDNDNVNPYGVNRFSGANVSTIAIEVPITRITSDGKPAATSANPVIGMYASTARQSVRVSRGSNMDSDTEGQWVQVSRMANPLVNELIINTPAKDKWNAAEPEDEAQFQTFYKNP